VKPFKDKLGREWQLDMSFDLWMTIKREAGVDLLDVAMPDGQSLAKLLDPGTFGVVIWLYVAEQAAAKGVDRTDFWRALDGLAIYSANEAMAADMADFSRNPWFTALRVGIQEAAVEIRAKQAEMEAPDSVARQVMRAALSTPGATPASSPESSAEPRSSGDGSASSSGPPRPGNETSGTAAA